MNAIQLIYPSQHLAVGKRDKLLISACLGDWKRQVPFCLSQAATMYFINVPLGGLLFSQYISPLLYCLCGELEEGVFIVLSNISPPRFPILGALGFYELFYPLISRLWGNIVICIFFGPCLSQVPVGNIESFAHFMLLIYLWYQAAWPPALSESSQPIRSSRIRRLGMYIQISRPLRMAERHIH